MPLYDFRCQECGGVSEHFAGVEERQVSCGCGGISHRLITSRYYLNPDVEFLTDNITGDPIRITSRKMLDRVCKENGITQKTGKGWW